MKKDDTVENSITINLNLCAKKSPKASITILGFFLLFLMLSSCSAPAKKQLVTQPVPTDTIIQDTENDNSNDTVLANPTIVLEYNETYETPKIIGNVGSNIENGGLCIASKKKIYYIDNGIWQMSKNGENKTLITDMHYIASLNYTDEFLYFVSNHDGNLYRVVQEENSTPEQLPLNGASNMVIIGDYLYYTYSVGENSNNMIYRSNLDGLSSQCLMIKGNNICPDGVYFYYINLDDNSTIWRYNTITKENQKLSDDSATQINVVDNKIYYISLDMDCNVVRLERDGTGKAVVVTQSCFSLNNINSLLIYQTKNNSFLQSYDISNGENDILIEYDDINSVNIAGTWIFFESYPIDGLEACIFQFNTLNKLITPRLPEKVYGFIKNINPSNLSFKYDIVHFYKGAEAIKQYAINKDISQERAEEELHGEENAFYIYNANSAWLNGKVSEWTTITLQRRANALSENSKYSADLKTIQSIYENNPNIDEKLLFQITILDYNIVGIKEVYYPLN